MFKSLGLLSTIPCPELGQCSRNPCIFSHIAPIKRPAQEAQLQDGPQVTKRQKTASQTPAGLEDSTLSAISRTLPPRSALASSASGSPVASTSRVPSASSSVKASPQVAKLPTASLRKASSPVLSSTTKPTSTSSLTRKPAAVAAVASTSNVPPAALALQLKGYSVQSSHTPFAQRQTILRLMHEQYRRIYSSTVLYPPTIPERKMEAQNLANLHASEQEFHVYSASKKLTYKNTAAQSIAKLKKRRVCDTEFEQGTNEEVDRKMKEQEKRANSIVKGEMIEKYGMTAKDVEKWEKDFVWEVPMLEGNTALETEEGFARDCGRCKKNFIVKAELSESEKTACNYHWGKLVSETINGKKERLWSCCRGPTQCSFGAHVFQDADPASLHARQPFKPTSEISTTAKPLDIAAIDCELIYTTAGMSLARLTVCSGAKKVVLDEHVRPDPATPLDYATRFSGIKAEDIAGAKLDFDGLRVKLGKFIGPETLLVGHGLDNDLKALRLIHRPDRIVDTSVLYPHPAGYRHSLRNLSKMHLGIFIQDQGYHDSKEDALIALELVKVKCDSDQSKG